MKIIVSKIPEEGIEVHSRENAETLAISPSDIILTDNVQIDATISREDETFFVDGTIKATLLLPCNRCAEEFTYTIDTLFHCHEEPMSHATTDSDQSLRKRDMDIDHYAGEEIEINNLIREQVLLAVPMHPLCKPDCLGLCPKCGQNLNIKKCNCVIEETANPFQGIKKLFE